MATAVKEAAAGLVRTHLVVGWPDQVHAALARAEADGRLVGVGAVTELADRRVQVSAQLREDRPRRFRLSWPGARVWVWLAVGALGVAAVAGVVWAVVAAVTALVAAISAAVAAVAAWVSTYWPALAGVAVVVVLLGAAGGVKKCVGMHCGGCRR